MTTRRPNYPQFASSLSTYLQDDLRSVEGQEDIHSRDNVSVDSCPAEQPIKGSTYDISQHHTDAIQQKKINIANGKKLKQDWMDAEHWRMLASRRGYTLPQYHIPLSCKGIEKVLHELGLDQKFFRECYGVRITYQEFVDLNPTAPLWAFAGWMLEQLEN